MIVSGGDAGADMGKIQLMDHLDLTWNIIWEKISNPSSFPVPHLILSRSIAKISSDIKATL